MPNISYGYYFETYGGVTLYPAGICIVNVNVNVNVNVDFYSASPRPPLMRLSQVAEQCFWLSSNCGFLVELL